MAGDSCRLPHTMWPPRWCSELPVPVCRRLPGSAGVSRCLGATSHGKNTSRRYSATAHASAAPPRLPRNSPPLNHAAGTRLMEPRSLWNCAQALPQRQSRSARVRPCRPAKETHRAHKPSLSGPDLSLHQELTPTLWEPPRGSTTTRGEYSLGTLVGWDSYKDVLVRNRSSRRTAGSRFHPLAFLLTKRQQRSHRKVKVPKANVIYSCELPLLRDCRGRRPCGAPPVKISVSRAVV
ncbi:unnamed protein product [Coccothraustes coccothraustes]